MARRVVIGELRVHGSTATMGGGRGRSCGRTGPSMRRPTGSCAITTARVRNGPTPTCLVDHLRWMDRECLTLDAVRLRDLERYMGLLGAEVRMPLGEPWRVGKRPYGPAALSITASCLKGFYLHQAALGVNPELGKSLNRARLPSRADRRRTLPGPHHDVAAGEPTCAARPAAAASEDAARRRARQATGGRVFGSGPPRRDLA